MEYENVQIWSEEWHCHNGPRVEEVERSVSQRSRKRTKGSQKDGKDGEGGGRFGGPCLTCGGLQFRGSAPRQQLERVEEPPIRHVSRTVGCLVNCLSSGSGEMVTDKLNGEESN